MNRSTLSYLRVIVLLSLIAIFFAECFLCLTITEINLSVFHWSREQSVPFCYKGNM